VGIEYLQLLLDKMMGEVIPARFVIFGMVGAMGVLVHLSILFVLLRVAGESFLVSQAISTVIVMTLNFFLNNAITYRDRRLRGRALVFGLMTFYLACSVVRLSICGSQTLYSRAEGPGTLRDWLASW